MEIALAPTLIFLDVPKRLVRRLDRQPASIGTTWRRRSQDQEAASIKLEAICQIYEAIELSFN